MKNAPRWAKVGITIQFLALVLADVQPFVAGALVAAVLCWAAVTLFFFARYRATIAVAALTVAALVALKVVLRP